jgi:hypothetical protein
LLRAQLPGWLLLFPLLGDYLSNCVDVDRVKQWAIWSTILFIALASLFVGEATTGYARVLLPSLLYKDPTLETFEWEQLPPELRRRGLIRPGVFIITNNWTFAGKIDYAFDDTIKIVIFRGEHKQYDFRYDPKSFVGHDAIIIGRIDSISGVDRELAPYFESIEKLPTFALGRAGMHEIELSIYSAHKLKMPIPAQFRRF